MHLVPCKRTSWAAGLELVGDDERCVALAGLLPLRLLAERAGLTAGISAAMRRPDHDPDYDRGQVLVDLGLVQLAGGQAIGDFQALRAPGEADRPGPLDPDGLAVPGRGRRAAGGADPSGGVPVPAPVVGNARSPGPEGSPG